VNTILNISAYQFVPLVDTLELQERLLARAQALQLKGTILLAEEGINLFLAGPPADVRDFVAQLHIVLRSSSHPLLQAPLLDCPFQRD
jgi:UPF0176 protein